MLTMAGSAQTTAFTYQGALNDHGVPANGSYDLTFTLCTNSTGPGQIGSSVTNLSVPVSSGLFTVALDFGASFPGADRWLEIAVRTNGGSGYVILTPRQKLTPAPYAITAANLSGSLPASQLTGPVPPASSGSLTNHSDILVAGLTAGQVLVYNGAAWMNAPANSPAPSNNIPVTLSYSGTNIAVNAALGTHFRLLATNNFQLQNPTGASDAQRMLFEVVQDAVGGRTISLAGAFKLGQDLPVLNLTTNANARDFITCVCSGTNFYVLGFIKGY